MAFEHKHLIDINEYSDTDIMTILETAKTLSEINQRKIKKVPTLKGPHGREHVQRAFHAHAFVV